MDKRKKIVGIILIIISLISLFTIFTIKYIGEKDKKIEDNGKSDVLLIDEDKINQNSIPIFTTDETESKVK